MKPKSAEKEPEPKVPADLRKVLAAAPKVMALWKNLTPIARRDFIFWIDSAKLPATRKHRIGTLGSRLAAGKRRPCCFMIVPMNLYKALDAHPKSKATWKDLSPTERRDFVDWINSDEQSEARKNRTEKVCVMLTAGKRRPS